MYPRNWLFCASLLVASGVAPLAAADRPEPPKVVEEIVAKVNGDIITRGELEKNSAEIVAALRQQGLAGSDLETQAARAPGVALSRQIDQLLLVQQAKDLNLNVDADLTREIAGIQTESKIPDPEKFHQWVKEQSGQTFEDFRQARKNKLLTDRVIGEEVWRNIVIPEADLQKYYDAHKGDFVRKESVTLREILVSSGDGKPASVAAAEAKAKALVVRARANTDKFTDLVKANSDAPSAADEGLLPPYERGKLNKSIEDVVFKQNKGYVTDPILISGVGFEILRVEDHVNSGQATFDESKAEIMNLLSAPVAEPKLRTYLTGLREKAFLEIKPGYADADAAPNKDTTWKDAGQLTPETTTKAAVANRRHMKKLFGVVPYGMTGKKDTGPAPAPAVTPVPQTPAAANADGSPR